MTTLATDATIAAPARAVRTATLALAAGALVAVALCSLAIGTKSIPLSVVIDSLLHPTDTQDSLIVTDLRVPRTILGVLVGAALGLAGALMQALTRNPLADPGLLGVNAGASAGVITAIGLLGIGGATGYVWFAFAGAAIAAVVVYLLGTAGRSGATPVRLALAGTAVAAALIAYTYGVALTDPELVQRFNQWVVGALAGRDASTVRQVAPFLVAGIALALALPRSLNALALGDEAATALGARVGRTRIAGALAITLLCGAAVAAAGPIVFVGLTIPHVARALVGPDQRWLLPSCALLGPVLLLCADVVGRVVARPAELEVGIVTAFLGAPVFIALVRRRRIAQL